MPVENVTEVGFVRLSRRFLPVLTEVKREGIPSKIYYSSNSKTGGSINLPIAGTCNPTKLCMSSCYAMRGPMVFSNSIQKQTENFILFQHLETALEAEVVRVCQELKKDIKNQSWIRWNGSGDLIPGSVRVINKFAELYPNIIQWVISRKPAMIESLADLKPIRLLVSLDETTPPAIAARLRATKLLFKNAKVKFSFIRTGEKQKIPTGIAIVFNEHIANRRLAHEDKRTCHATVAGASHENSCDTCRRCFS